MERSILVVGGVDGYLCDEVSSSERLAAISELVDGHHDIEHELYSHQYSCMVVDGSYFSSRDREWLTKMRVSGNTIPVLVAVDKSQATDGLRSLEAGADDYILKPWNKIEFVARVKSLLSKAKVEQEDRLEVGEVEISKVSQEIKKRGEVMHLAHQEHALLYSLMSRRGRIFGRQELLNQISSSEEEHSSNILEVLICNVRRKVGYSFIKTQRGSGYYVE